MDTELIEAIKTIAPEMYRQTIMWGWVTNITFTVGMMLFAMAIIWGYRKVRPQITDSDDLIPLYLVTGLLGFVSLLGIVCGIVEMIRLEVAPYSYILSQIGS